MDARWLVGAGVALGVAAAPAAADTTPEPGPTFTVVSLPGTPVEVSTDPRAPVSLTAGTWSDVLGADPNRVHYFSYDRRITDSTVHVGVVESATESSDAVAVAVKLPDAEGTVCDDGSEGVDYTSPYAVTGAAVSIGPDELGDTDSPCVDADRLLIEVSRGDSGLNDVPVAIRVVEEAPPSSTADLPPAVETAQVRLPEVDDAGETTGSTSLDGATLLEPGRYTTTVAEGEQRLWRVHLDWGQQLSVRAVVPTQDEAAVAALEYLTPEVDLTMLDPRFQSLRDSVEGYDTDGYYDPSAEARLVDGTPPVAVANRFTGLPAVVPGDYVVGLAVAPAEDRDPLQVPVTLAIDVVGEATGAPSRPAVATGPDGAVEGYDPATPFLVGDGVWSADVTSADGASSGEEATAASDDAGSGGRRVAGLVVGGVSLLSCAAGVLLLVRRRSARPALR